MANTGDGRAISESINICPGIALIAWDGRNLLDNKLHEKAAETQTGTHHTHLLETHFSLREYHL